MNNQLQQKLIDGAIKALTATLTGSGLLGFSNTWIGKVTFDSFKARLNQKATVLFPDPPGEELLRQWSTRVLYEAFEGLSAVLLLVVVGLLLLLVGHVVFRGNLGEGDGKPAGDRPLLRHYKRFYPQATLVVFLLLVVLLSMSTSQSLMVSAFALLVLPGTLYLVLYSADLRRPRFATRFTWIACAMLVFGALFALPFLYGKRQFDIELVQVERADGSVGFAFKDVSRFLCRVERRPGTGNFAFWIDRDDENWRLTDDPPVALSSLVEFMEAPALVDDEAASAEVSDIFDTLGG